MLRNVMKRYSLSSKIVGAFIIFQFVVLWVVQFLLEFDKRFLIHETYMAVAGIVMSIIGVLRIFKAGGLKKRLTNLQIALIFMALLSIIATIFSTDPWTSLVGREKRFEGLYSLLCYYLVCAWATTVADKHEQKILIYEYLAVGLISSIVGIISGLSLIPDGYTHWQGVAAIPYGNPNFFGSMMSMTSAVAFAVMLYSKTKSERIVGGVILFVSFLSTFSCDSSSPLVGNIMMFLLVVFAESIVVILRKNRGRFTRLMLGTLVGIFLWLASGFIVNSIRNNSVVNELSRDVYYMDEGLTSNKMFSNRMGAWKYTISRIPDYWMTGVGPDNFYALAWEADPELGIKHYDRVHNEYLQIAITQGVPAIIIYLVFLFIIFISGLKRWFKKEEIEPIYILAFLPYLAYIAQAFFNISTIQVAPFFWIICGLCSAGIRE